ncbi:MAG: hypothetical protein V3S89_06780, partial [Desulfobacterales bacterium]
PTTASVKAEINIHESSLEKVKIGDLTRITMDAMPGQAFIGYVATIAPLPDPTSMFMNPDLKVYNSDIYIENNGVEIRTGMSCKAEIIIEQHENAVYVPVQAVIRVKGKSTVYVAKGNSSKAREVTVGLDNNRMVHIISGLKEGEYVLLAPPLAEGEVESTIVTSMDMTPLAGKKTLKGSAPTGKIPAKGKGRSEQVRKKTGQTHGRAGGKGGTPGARNPTPEQRKKWRDRQANMSPQEREKMSQQWQKRREQYENASPEQKEKMRQQMAGR